ncbi:3-keto-5-aminohexanoate cleavage protein [Desulfovibrio sp. OttesenSCG-928-O18]|nr:3-keto-5-aminohexanoate cleavage protein [Desulfovibrio sp. OttesenSCG-928-O18]
MSNKLIITVATTGSITTRENHPDLPLHPKEIAQSVYECYQAGAAMAHVHVRDDAGKPSMAMDKFAETVGLIREKCPIIINMTSSGGRGLVLTDEDRIDPIVALKPEMCSLDCGSVNFGDRIFENHPHFLQKLATRAREAGVKPEIECFDVSMIENGKRMFKEGFLDGPMHFQFVMGVRGGMPATIENLMFMKSKLPSDATWSVIGVGSGHMPLMVTAMMEGGHVRVGMEDNVFYKKGVLAKSNAQFVERTVRLAAEFDRPVATVDEARKMLGVRAR